jgi:hypothetical protein
VCVCITYVYSITDMDLATKGTSVEVTAGEAASCGAGVGDRTWQQLVQEAAVSGDIETLKELLSLHVDRRTMDTHTDDQPLVTATSTFTATTTTTTTTTSSLGADTSSPSSPHRLVNNGVPDNAGSYDDVASIINTPGLHLAECFFLTVVAMSSTVLLHVMVCHILLHVRVFYAFLRLWQRVHRIVC